MNRHLQLGINSCNKVCTKYKFINENGSSYVPPEYYMIFKYTEYYNNEITDKIIEEEKAISEVIVKRFDLYKNNDAIVNTTINKIKNIDELMEFFKKYCIICSFSVFKLLYPLPNIDNQVMQVISAIADDDTIEKLKQYMEKRNIKITIQKNNIYEQEINIICYGIINEDGFSIGKIYNYLSYHIIPYNIIQGFKICHPYINKKHLLLDYIVTYAFLKTNNIIEEIKYYYECLNKEDVKLFNNYAGTYVNPIISKKILTNELLKEINMPGKYEPAIYYHKNKTYKVIEKQINRCN
jgi:hypothetical protein